jgi:two-component system cell cycle sensor histidine kinase/response regulator CckA
MPPLSGRYIKRGLNLRMNDKADSAVPRGTERILIVDDEPSQRFIVNRAMSRLGYRVVEAKSGDKAVQLMKDASQAQRPSPYDLIMLDMIMGDGLDGLETLTEILKLYPDQIVMIVSGHAEDARCKAAQELGADWLSKPYDAMTLAKAARQAIER